MTSDYPPTNNEAWGFWGSIRRDADPAEAWRLAIAAITKATRCEAIAVRDFLDSRDGRHFADDVASRVLGGMALPQAIDAAVTLWMGWTIGRRTAFETGIPAGLPYLEGLVTHHEVMADMAD